MNRERNILLAFAVGFLFVIGLGIYFIFYGFPINETKLVNRVEDYLVEQGESKDGFEQLEVEYHPKSGYYVVVTYKDEPEVAYFYRYFEHSDGVEKVSRYGESILNTKVNMDTYKFKHDHQTW